MEHRHDQHEHHHRDDDGHGHSFDERAATWDDDPTKAQRAREIADAIAAAVPLTTSMRLFEYGAGTGLVTQALRGHVGPVTLCDTSAGMREMIQRKIDAGVLTEARVWDVDLSTSPAPADRFELVVTSMTLHHIPDLGPVLAAFHHLLADGGRLCIVDLVEEDGSFHGEGFHGHHGFKEDELTAQLEAAGFAGIEFRPCHTMHRERASYELFLATAVPAR